MATFIRQRKLEDKTASGIPQIGEFSFAAWNFILSIYESRWDKLNANKNGNSFRQCVSSQFKTKILKNISDNNQVLSKQDKQAKVSKVSLSISFRLSKSILAKLKFFKKN